MAIVTYNILVKLCTPFFILILFYRLFIGKEDSSRLKERFGLYNIKKPKSKLVWFHAASVGEVKSIFPIVKKLHYNNYSVLITTHTILSVKIIQQELPKGIGENTLFSMMLSLTIESIFEIILRE